MTANIIFMGSPEFALPSLKILDDHFSVSAVITQPDRRAGRGKTLTPPPVKILALERGIEVFQPPSLRDEDAVEHIRSFEPDLIVVAAFGQILRTDVLEIPALGCINVHASLLPRWRGASPINAAILHGDNETGVTLMQMDEGLDTGPILASQAIPISPETDAGQLSERLAELGGMLLREFLPQIIAGEIIPKTQDNSLATYAPLLKKSDGNLDFGKPAELLARQIRAYTPWPGTYTHWNNKPLKVHRAHAVPKEPGPQGLTRIYQGLPAIGTSDGLLVLDILQPAGKKQIDGATFLNGARDWGKI